MFGIRVWFMEIRDTVKILLVLNGSICLFLLAHNTYWLGAYYVWVNICFPFLAMIFFENWEICKKRKLC